MVRAILAGQRAFVERDPDDHAGAGLGGGREDLRGRFLVEQVEDYLHDID